MKLRLAHEGDVPQLLDLEERSFPGDRISERSWRELIGRPSAIVLVAAHGRAILGAAVLLTRRGTRVARLYSIAVNQTARGAGLGRALLTRLMGNARRRGCAEMRLESRIDNLPAFAISALPSSATPVRTTMSMGPPPCGSASALPPAG